MRRRAFTLALASFSCITSAIGGAAFASIPDANGIIHACFKNSSANQGALRIIDTDARQVCASNESPLQWRQSSPAVPKVTVSQGSGPAIIVGDEFPPAATVTITAPTSGRVIVNAWVSIGGLAPDNLGVVRLRDAVSGDVSTAQAARMAVGGEEAISVGWVFQVTAGERVFELGARGEFGTINPGSATITAVFLPD